MRGRDRINSAVLAALAMALAGLVALVSPSAMAASSSRTKADKKAGAARLYQEAARHYKSGRTRDAIAFLQLLIKRFPDTPFARQGRKDLNMLYQLVKRVDARDDRSGQEQDQAIDKQEPPAGPPDANAHSLETGHRNGEEAGEEDVPGRTGAAQIARGPSLYGTRDTTPDMTPENPEARRDGASLLQGQRKVVHKPMAGDLPRGAVPQAIGNAKERHGPSSASRRMAKHGSGREGTQLTAMDQLRPGVRPLPSATKSRIVRRLRPDKFSPAVIRRYNEIFRAASPDRVFFAQEEFKLGHTAGNVLSAQAGWLVRHPFLRVLVAGHADEGGSAEADMIMSRKRAESVRDFLVAKGVDPDQIVIRAHGRDQPVALCDGEDREECAVQNRRVLVRITGK